MFRFLTQDPTQSTRDVTLLAEAIRTSECFDDIHLYFGPIGREIEEIRNEGLLVDQKRVNVEFFFTADFKVIYSVTGAFGPTGKHACPCCQVPSTLLDKTYDELKTVALNRKDKRMSLANLESRSAISNRIGKPDIPLLQKANTYNVFHLERGGWGCLGEPTNIVPPTLHIHIGIVNKIVKCLDGIVSVWNRKMRFNQEGVSPAAHLLANALARCGARRENYYSGQLSGEPCSNLMSRMPAFCALFFHRRAKNWGLVTDAVPSVRNLESKLKDVASIYTGKRYEDEKGLEFYLRTHQKWNARMITKWDTIVVQFIRALRNAIGESHCQAQLKAAPISGGSL